MATWPGTSVGTVVPLQVAVGLVSPVQVGPVVSTGTSVTPTLLRVWFPVLVTVKV